MDDLDDAGFLSINRWPGGPVKNYKSLKNHWDTKKLQVLNKAPDRHPETGTPKFEL